MTITYDNGDKYEGEFVDNIKELKSVNEFTVERISLFEVIFESNKIIFPVLIPINASNVSSFLKSLISIEVQNPFSFFAHPFVFPLYRPIVPVSNP